MLSIILFCIESARGLTSLEAGDGSGYLYTSGEKVGKGREGEEEDKSQDCCRSEKSGFPPVYNHAQRYRMHTLLLMRVYRQCRKGMVRCKKPCELLGTCFEKITPQSTDTLLRYCQILEESIQQCFPPLTQDLGAMKISK